MCKYIPSHYAYNNSVCVLNPACVRFVRQMSLQTAINGC